jgi:hypothetical protein
VGFREVVAPRRRTTFNISEWNFNEETPLLEGYTPVTSEG